MSLKEGLPTKVEQPTDDSRMVDPESLPPTDDEAPEGLRDRLARFSRRWSRRYVEMRFEAGR